MTSICFAAAINTWCNRQFPEVEVEDEKQRFCNRIHVVIAACAHPLNIIWVGRFWNRTDMTDIDDLWASLQADDAAQRNKSKKKEKKISSAKAKALKEVPAAKPKEVAIETASVHDKEVTPENMAQHMHFHIRSVIGGNLGQRKESLRVIARCVYHTQCCVSRVHCLSVAELPLAPTIVDRRVC